MLKSFTTLTLGLLLSSAAFAEVKLHTVYNNTECTIANNEVTRTVSMGKEKEVKFTQKTTMVFAGIEEAAQKASAVATGSEYEEDMFFEATLDGKKFSLNNKDSDEAMILIRIMVKACQIN